MSEERVSDETLRFAVREYGSLRVDTVATMAEEIIQHRQRERELREVVPYLQHNPSCDTTHPFVSEVCSCGLDALLSKYPWLRQMMEEAGR